MGLATGCLCAQIPATYPVSNPELCIPELDGKTSKMYRCVAFVKNYHHLAR